MELKELITYRQYLIDESKDSEGYVSDSQFLDFCLPVLNENKRIDTTDVTNIYCSLEKGTVKVDAYTYNETGERLQIFIINDDSIRDGLEEKKILVSKKSDYDELFGRALNFVRKSYKKQLAGSLQDSSPAWLLAHELGTSELIDQLDSIEIFLLSLTATVELRGSEPTLKSIEFEDDDMTVSYTHGNEKRKKDLTIIRTLVDLNFFYNNHIAEGNSNPLHVDFSEGRFQESIPCLHVATEKSFDTYLCTLPATLLAKLYSRHNSRLLEKNVRSFLQLNNSVNKGMQDTIRKKPEKFIAFNNGITITATNSELKEMDGVSYLKSLTDFQIVNGGQTTATLFFSQKQGLNVEKVRVMAKITVAREADEETLNDLISDISTFSNAQSKVSKVDLRARNQQLVKIKSLSEGILTVSGKKWFFERAKGEYATILRINSGKKAQFEKMYPKERRFTKEDLAKYYVAWGETPYAVKKGGEKVFRLFLEEISGEGSSKKPAVINRMFYEDLIARIILFRSLEQMYGAGKGSMGQLRSAVVPYALSIVYSVTTGDKRAQPFDLLKIWRAEKLEPALEAFFTRLMKLMNDLIKKYSKSDDLGEYSKKQELWTDIIESKEIADFFNKDANNSVLEQYSISAAELKKRQKAISKSDEVDFEPLLDIAGIFDKGAKFYRTLLDSVPNLTPSKCKKLETIIYAVKQNDTLDHNHLKFEKEFLKEVSVSHPKLLDSLKAADVHTNTAFYIIRKYNGAVEKGETMQLAFDAVKEIARKKEAPYYSVFGEIGRQLDTRSLPSIKQLIQASEYVKTLAKV